MSSEKSHFDLEEVSDLHNRSTTLYHSVGHVIRSKIQSGAWAVEQQIPSERALMEMLNVSRSTVRQGIEYLVKEGVLIRIQGKGTFVAPPKIQKSVLRLLEFSDVIRSNGLKLDTQLLGKDLVDPSPDIQAQLELAEGERTVWLQRLLRVNSLPMLIETSYLPRIEYKNISEQYTGEQGPRDLLQTHFGIRIARARETFEPVILEDEEADLLGVTGGAPALWVEHLAFDGMERPVAFVTCLFRGDRCRFYTDLRFD